MIVLRESSAYIHMVGCKEELFKLRDHFKFNHPKRHLIQIHALWRNTKGEQGWDGKVGPMKVHRGGTAEIFRGYKSDLLEAMKEMNIEMGENSELLDSPFVDMTTDDIPANCIKAEFGLDENQRLCIVEWLKHGTGIGKIAVNGGKTATFAGFAAVLKSHLPEARFLYVTDRERLTSQVDKEMQRFLPNFEISKFGGGGHDYGGKDMVVCTLAMIRTHYDDLLQTGWFNSFNAVLFDESHHAAAPNAEKMMMAIQGAFFRIGASDTVKADDPIAQMQIKSLLGPVRTIVEQSGLIEAGRSAVPHIYLIDPPGWSGRMETVPLQPALKSTAWVLLDGEDTLKKGVYKGPVYAVDDAGQQVLVEKKTLEGVKFKREMVPRVVPGLHCIELDGVDYEVDSSFCLLDRAVDKCIVQFKERNQLICEWAKHFSEQRKRTIVVATRTMHVLILETMLSDVIDARKVRILVGTDSKGQRDKTFAWFRKTRGAVLVTSLVKEGVSINEIEAGIVADSVADAEFANQIIGRFLRKKEGENEAEIVWFIDRQQGRFERSCRSLIRKLSQTAGFMFYHPFVHPTDNLEDISIWDSKAELEFAADKGRRPPALNI